MRTYVAEPSRGGRNWKGKPEAKAAVYGNPRRVRGNRGKQLQQQRGERIERNFAHQFDTGGMDRLWVRGRQNVHKKLLIQAAASNLALLMRLRHGSGKPKAAHDRLVALIFAFLIVLAAREVSSLTILRFRRAISGGSGRSSSINLPPCRSPKTRGLDTGC